PQPQKALALQPRLETDALLHFTHQGHAFLAVTGKRPASQGAQEKIVAEQQGKVEPGDVAEEKRPRYVRVLEGKNDRKTQNNPSSNWRKLWRFAATQSCRWPAPSRLPPEPNKMPTTRNSL